LTHNKQRGGGSGSSNSILIGEGRKRVGTEKEFDIRTKVGELVMRGE
jgi:hypothetical protein